MEHLLERLRIDNAVGAIPVHLGAGIWGTLAVALFGKVELLGTGLHRGAQVGIQTLGIVVCGVWAFGVAYLLFLIINRFFPFRVTPEEEHIGLNVSEHGAATALLDLFTAMDTQAKTGDLNLRAPVKPFTEVGQIAERYNGVLAALQKTEATTKVIVSAISDGIITFTKGGFLITSVNSGTETIFGYTERQMLGEPITILLDLPGSKSHESGLQHIAAMLPEWLAGDSREMIGQRADGRCVPMDIMIVEAEFGALVGKDWTGTSELSQQQ